MGPVARTGSPGGEATASTFLYNGRMRVGFMMATCLGAMSLVATGHADTFGGEVHGVRSIASVDELSSTGARDTRLPESLAVQGDGELTGGDFRFDWMVDDVRVGAGLAVFGVRDLVLSRPPGFMQRARVDSALGGSLESFVGYELMKGPFYLYVDLRVVLQGFEASVAAFDEASGEQLFADYGASSVGLGPRLGILVPVGLSLMIDLAAYQRVLGGIEGTTAFVGMGYWENDRNDSFTDELDRSFGGDF